MRPVVPTVTAPNHRSDTASIRSPGTRRVRSQFRAPGTSLYSIGRCVSTSGRLPPASGPRVRSPVCRATGPASGRASSVRSSVRSPLRARFFAILRTAWFQSSCLEFAWSLGSFLVLLRSCLWCRSSDHHVAFVQVTSCTLLNYKMNTCKFISPIWLCWSSNTEIQSKWAKGPFPYKDILLLLLLIRGPKEAFTLILTRSARKKINIRNSHVNHKHLAVNQKTSTILND